MIYCNGQGRLDERMDTIPEDDMLMDIASLSKRSTGLEVIIWLQQLIFYLHRRE